MSFLVRYPEFANVDKARIELAQQDAENQMSRKIWGKKFEQGRDALTAHLLYVSGALTKSGHSMVIQHNPRQVKLRVGYLLVTLRLMLALALITMDMHQALTVKNTFAFVSWLVCM